MWLHTMGVATYTPVMGQCTLTGFVYDPVDVIDNDHGNDNDVY